MKPPATYLLPHLLHAGCFSAHQDGDGLAEAMPFWFFSLPVNCRLYHPRSSLKSLKIPKFDIWTSADRPFFTIPLRTADSFYALHTARINHFDPRFPKELTWRYHEILRNLPPPLPSPRTRVFGFPGWRRPHRGHAILARLLSLHLLLPSCRNPKFDIWTSAELPHLFESSPSMTLSERQIQEKPSVSRLKFSRL